MAKFKTQGFDSAPCFNGLPVNLPAVFFNQFFNGGFDHAAFDVVKVLFLLLGGLHGGGKVLNGVFRPARGLKTHQQL